MLREYTPEDMQETVTMVREFFDHHRRLHGRDDPMNRDEAHGILLEWLGTEGNEVLVHQVDGQAVGFIRLRREGDVRWLEDLGVSRRCRGEGHGRRMITLLGEYLRGLGQDYIYAPVVPANTRAVEFYVECGFTNLNMIELQKDLRDSGKAEGQEHRGRNFELSWRTTPDPDAGV